MMTQLFKAYYAVGAVKLVGKEGKEVQVTDHGP